MAIRAPVFPIPSPQHYSDYGFDSQIDYFQVLDDPRRHGKRSAPEMRSPDSIRFTLRKPISKDDRGAKKRCKWWKAALQFWKRNARKGGAAAATGGSGGGSFAHGAPVYMVESGGGGANTPCRTSRPGYGLLRTGMAYVSLRDVNVEERMEDGAGGAPASMPIYLVT